MKSVVVLLVSSLAAVASGFQYTNEWKEWKKDHGRVYESDDIEHLRHTIWETNMQFVIKHNAHADEFGFSVEMNEFADLASLLQLYCSDINIVPFLTLRSPVSLPSCITVFWVMQFLMTTQPYESQKWVLFLIQLIGEQRE